MQSKIVEKTRFTVVDQRGARHTVVVTAQMHDASTLDGSAWVEGLHSYRLATGAPVNVGDDGDLTLVATGETLRRV